MKNLSKNSKGFISLNVTLVLMAFLTLYLTAAFAIALSQQRDYVRSTCVTRGFEIQAKALKNVRQIFSLNPASTGIRLAIKKNLIAQRIATSTARFELLPALQTELVVLYQKQKTLDTIQRSLILKAQGEYKAQQMRLIFELNKGQKQLTGAWQHMITMSSYFISNSNPMIAIRADSEGGIGPNYEWQDKADQKQRLAYSWKMFFKTNASYQHFLSWANNLSLNCSITPDLGEAKWQLIINADKLSLSSY